MHGLRDDVKLKELAETMRDLARQVRNLRSGGVDLQVQKQRYVTWVQVAEGQLDSLFEDSSQWKAELFSAHYWHICDLPDSSPNPSGVISDEARRQANGLERLADDAENLIEWASRDNACLAVIDTHVLLHFEPPSQVDWLQLLDSRAVRLVIPLRVIEELDHKKYTARSRLAERARGIISWLRTGLGPDPQIGFPIREGVTMEVHMPSGPRNRGVDADQEVLDNCRTIRSAGADEMLLITDDAGLDVRARTYGIRTVPMPEKYLRKRQSD